MSRTIRRAIFTKGGGDYVRRKYIGLTTLPLSVGMKWKGRGGTPSGKIQRLKVPMRGKVGERGRECICSARVHRESEEKARMSRKKKN